MPFSSTHKAYLAGFLDGDGSIYARLKPNDTYRFGFQVAVAITFFQSSKNRALLEELQARWGLGRIRDRNDGISEWVIGKTADIRSLLHAIQSHLILKQNQAKLMLEVLDAKECVQNRRDFEKVMTLVERLCSLNYSKKRKTRILTP